MSLVVGPQAAVNPSPRSTPRTRAVAGFVFIVFAATLTRCPRSLTPASPSSSLTSIPASGMGAKMGMRVSSSFWPSAVRFLKFTFSIMKPMLSTKVSASVSTSR
jgi:hypothetical protein